MANKQAFYTLDTGVANNWFSAYWKQTRMQKAAGWVYMASSDGTTKDTTGTATNDKWGGNADPTLDTFNTAIFNGVAGAWWVGSGPVLLRIPITVASTGTFIRGESISQATSGATGELLGYVFDATNAGWIIVAPRTGTFNNTNVITGGVSAATATPNGTIKSMSQEVMFHKTVTTAATMNIYWICVDSSTESAQLFSQLATSAGCTATVAPGEGGTSNGFPANAVVITGNGGSTTGANIGPTSTGGITAHALVVAANATPSSGISADGTYWVMLSNTVSSVSSTVIGLFRIDDGEPGDVSPFVYIVGTSTTVASYSRTAGTISISLNTPSNFFGTNVQMIGYTARGTGFTTDPGATYFKAATGARAASQLWVENNASSVLTQNHPATNKPSSTDSVVAFCDRTGAQMVKGRLRWMRLTSLGALYDTTDTKTWVSWFSNATTINGTGWIGPWDGTTTPSA